MIKKEINFIITGREAKGISEEIKKIIEEEFYCDIHILTENISHYKEQTKAIDPVAVGAFVLAIPGAILAFSNLIERIKNKKKLDVALEKIQKRVVQKKEVIVKIQSPDGVIKELSTVNTVEILDYFSK